MSKYTDVYLVPIPEENLPAYTKLAKACAKVYLKHGALKYREYVGSDLDIEGVVPFPKRIKLNPGEVLVYAAIEFKSEAHRNKVVKAFMADPAVDEMMKDQKPPFDCRRMVYGGFKILVDF